MDALTIPRYIIIVTPISAVFGCYICCWFSLIFGRIKAFHFTNLMYLVGNSLVLSIQSFVLYCNSDDSCKNSDAIQPLIESLFLIARIICGLAVGGSSYLVPLYSTPYIVRELAPIEIYAKLGSINQFMITFGILISYLLGFFLSGK